MGVFHVFKILQMVPNRFLSFFSMEDDKDHKWNKPTLSRPLSYAMLSEDTNFIKMNSFIHLATNFLKILFFLK